MPNFNAGEMIEFGTTSTLVGNSVGNAQSGIGPHEYVAEESSSIRDLSPAILAAMKFEQSTNRLLIRPV